MRARMGYSARHGPPEPSERGPYGREQSIQPRTVPLLGPPPIERRFLPRVKRHQLLDLFGVEKLEPVEATDASLATLIEAGLSAAALTKLDAGDASRQLRRAIVEVVGGTLPMTELAGALGVWPRSLRRMIVSAPAPRDLVHAIRLQLDLRRQKAPDLARLASAF